MLLLSVAGIGIAIVTMLYDNQSNIQTRAILHMQPPFKRYIACNGIVESRSKNISIGSAVSGVVTKVYVKSGDSVKAGDALFHIDDSVIKSKLAIAKAEVKEANSLVTKAQHQLQILKDLKEIDPKLVTKKSYLLEIDTLQHAKATLNLAKAKVRRVEEELKHYTVNAPIDARVLQCKMGVGEYFNANNKKTLMVLGSREMNIRVDINEYDVWRFKPHTRAIAFVKGHPELKVALHYEYTKPYIIPKTSLNGLNTERTDTRVLQVIYSFWENNFPLYVGEQLDLFIEVPQKVQ